MRKHTKRWSIWVIEMFQASFAGEAFIAEHIEYLVTSHPDTAWGRAPAEAAPAESFQIGLVIVTHHSSSRSGDTMRLETELTWR